MIRMLLIIWTMLFGAKINAGEIWTYVDQNADPFKRQKKDVKVIDVREGYVKFQTISEVEDFTYASCSLCVFDFRWAYDLKEQ